MALPPNTASRTATAAPTAADVAKTLREMGNGDVRDMIFLRVRAAEKVAGRIEAQLGHDCGRKYRFARNTVGECMFSISFRQISNTVRKKLALPAGANNVSQRIAGSSWGLGLSLSQRIAAGPMPTP